MFNVQTKQANKQTIKQYYNVNGYSNHSTTRNKQLSKDSRLEFKKFKLIVKLKYLCCKSSSLYCNIYGIEGKELKSANAINNYSRTVHGDKYSCIAAIKHKNLPSILRHANLGIGTY